MVKHINAYFDEKEYKKLRKKKGDLTWHDFILKLLEKKT